MTSNWEYPPLDVQIISNSTLNITLSTFSLYDALKPESEYSMLQFDGGDATAYVFMDACGSDASAQNCTAICTESSTAFASLDALRNCMAYPTIANEYAYGRLPSNGQNIAQTLGIEASGVNDTISVLVINTIGQCLKDYCTSLPGCLNSMKNELDGNPESAMLNFTSTFYVVPNGSYYGYTDFNLCSFLPESALTVNQDIGGIGVYISYWIQIAIALLGFLGIFFCGPGLYYLSLFALTPRHGRRNAEIRAKDMGAKVRELHLPALATALTDFQKAQCFFMLAINIAALVDKVHGGLQPQSLQQLYNTYILIKSVSISGYLPITFNLFTLHLVDMVSWYLLILSAITIAVSITTLFAVGIFNPSPGDLNYISGQAASGGPVTCGGYQPGAWCYNPLGYIDSYTDDVYTYDPSNGSYSMLAFCLVVLLLLVAYHLQFHQYLSSSSRRWNYLKFKTSRSHVARWSRKSYMVQVYFWHVYLTFQQRLFDRRNSRSSSRWTSEKLSSHEGSRWHQWRILSWTQTEKCQRLKRRSTRGLRNQWILTKDAAARSSKRLKKLVTGIGFARFLAFGVYVTFFGLYVNFFMIFSYDLAWFASTAVDTNSWSFGQIVAITVWAAPVCEWLHLELRGMKRGFEHRLLPPYHVVSHTADADRDEITKPLLTPKEDSHDPKGAYEELTAVTPTSPEEHRHNLQNGGYTEVAPVEESPISRASEEEEDITWQLPDFRRSETMRLDDYEV